MKKKHLYILIILAILIGFFFLTAKEFPKNISRLPFFFFLILLDGYLWFYVRSRIRRKYNIGRIVIATLYWLPFIALVAMVFVSAFIPYDEWKKSLKIYIGGVIFVVYAAKIFPIITLLIDDIRRFFQYLFLKLKDITAKRKFPEGRKISRSKFLGNLGLIAGGIAFSGLISGMIKWVYNFRVRKEYLTFAHLPEAFDGMRIVQISDLHLGSWTSRSKLEEVVEIINEQDADLVFFTGDLVDYITAEAFDYSDILGNISSKYGVYATLGNHDYGDYTTWESAEAKEANMLELYDLFDDIGWKLLRNENHIIEKGDDMIAVLGVENWSAYSRFPRYGDLDQALKGAEQVPFKLLLSHDPTFWDEKVSKAYSDIDITFSGHTHGFQFGIDIPRLKWSPAQYMYRHWAGLYSAAGGSGRRQYLYVNRGTGTIGYPGRIGILPEITVVELLRV